VSLTVITLDHFILKVNDIKTSVDFYTSILGFTNGGQDGPFTVVRVNSAFQIQLAPWGTLGGEHYAFAVSMRQFNQIFDRIKLAEIEYGPSYDSVGSNTGSGTEIGAKGPGPTLYFFDPNKHLLEIRTYEK
jgi:catechol 2,3-dioxygenase-like lactoylglutathione lyase family enzyme